MCKDMWLCHRSDRLGKHACTDKSRPDYNMEFNIPGTINRPVQQGGATGQCNRAAQQVSATGQCNRPVQQASATGQRNRSVQQGGATGQCNRPGSTETTAVKQPVSSFAAPRQQPLNGHSKQPFYGRSQPLHPAISTTRQQFGSGQSAVSPCLQACRALAHTLDCTCLD